MTAAELQREAERAALDVAQAQQQAHHTTHAGDRRHLQDLASQQGWKAQQYAQAAWRKARREAATW